MDSTRHIAPGAMNRYTRRQCITNLERPRLREQKRRFNKPRPELVLATAAPALAAGASCDRNTAAVGPTSRR